MLLFSVCVLMLNVCLADWQSLCVLLGELHQKGDLSSQHVKVVIASLVHVQCKDKLVMAYT